MAHLPSRRGLCHKDRLATALLSAAKKHECCGPGTANQRRHAALQAAAIPTVCVPAAQAKSALEAGQLVTRELAESVWEQLGSPHAAVVKHARVNNALQVHVVTGPATLSALAAQLPAAGLAKAAELGAWCVQQYVPPLLLNGRKWSVRLNVAIVGRTVLLIHHEPLVLVAGRAAGLAARPGSVASHITNHSAQHRLPYFSEAEQTTTLSRLALDLACGTVQLSSSSLVLGGNIVPGERIEPSAVKPWQNDSGNLYLGMMDSLAATADAVLRTVGARGPTELLPLPGAWEVFGIDCLPRTDGTWAVCEVNEGPALAAHACKSLHEQLVAGLLHVTLKGWMSCLGSYDAGMPAGSSPVIDTQAWCAWDAPDLPSMADVQAVPAWQGWKCMSIHGHAAPADSDALVSTVYRCLVPATIHAKARAIAEAGSDSESDGSHI